MPNLRAIIDDLIEDTSEFRRGVHGMNDELQLLRSAGIPFVETYLVRREATLIERTLFWKRLLQVRGDVSDIDDKMGIDEMAAISAEVFR